MPTLARRTQEIKASPTNAMNKRAADMKLAGRDTIPLSLGEPDFHTPENIKAAGIAAIERNFTKYTPADGHGPLKEALSRKLARDNGLTFAPDQIVVGGGAKSIILAALLSIVDPGDEVIVPTPYWVTYPDLVTLVGGVTVFAPCNDTTGFKLTPSMLRSVLSPRTRAIIFNSPNNPSGAVYSIDEIKDLAAVLIDHPNVWVVTDELYEHIVYDNHKATSFAKAAPELAQRVITINGFSKGYVMTGWRLGFAAAAKPVIKSMAGLLSHMNGSPSSIGQAAAMEALDGDQAFIDQNRKTFEERRNLIIERANNIPGLSAVKPSGTFYCYINCGGWIGRVSAGGRKLETDVDASEALLDETGVAVMPGEAFGCSPFFRVSYALEVALLRKAMDRIQEFAQGLR
ncbi:MAG TPA: pyridoxal phosphate-dependent aminotransferase [Stellaceae bacterium]|nr:pyridoxal phosphate-dependent aminotransferase [Stellaceae bacterium]